MTNQFEVRGYWVPVTYGPKDGPQFISSSKAGTWANKYFGLNMWTLEWRTKS